MDDDEEFGEKLNMVLNRTYYLEILSNIMLSDAYIKCLYGKGYRDRFVKIKSGEGEFWEKIVDNSNPYLVEIVGDISQLNDKYGDFLVNHIVLEFDFNNRINLSDIQRIFRDNTNIKVITASIILDGTNESKILDIKNHMFPDILPEHDSYVVNFNILFNIQYFIGG
jgi:hypothetical protein